MGIVAVCGGKCITSDCSPAGACFDRSKEYRYSLWRRWSEEPLIGFVLLNPSTASAVESDRTMIRVQNFAKSSGHGGFYIVNAFAMIATDPEALRKIPPRAVGRDNDRHLAQFKTVVDRTVLGWGNFLSQKAFAHRLEALKDIFGTDSSALGLTKARNPRHPLYIRASAKFEPFVW